MNYWVTTYNIFYTYLLYILNILNILKTDSDFQKIQEDTSFSLFKFRTVV